MNPHPPSTAEDPDNPLGPARQHPDEHSNSTGQGNQLVGSKKSRFSPLAKLIFTCVAVFFLTLACIIFILYRAGILDRVSIVPGWLLSVVPLAISGVTLIVSQWAAIKQGIQWFGTHVWGDLVPAYKRIVFTVVAIAIVIIVIVAGFGMVVGRSVSSTSDSLPTPTSDSSTLTWFANVQPIPEPICQPPGGTLWTAVTPTKDQICTTPGVASLQQTTREYVEYDLTAVRSQRLKAKQLPRLGIEAQLNFPAGDRQTEAGVVIRFTPPDSELVSTNSDIPVVVLMVDGAGNCGIKAGPSADSDTAPPAFDMVPCYKPVGKKAGVTAVTLELIVSDGEVVAFVGGSPYSYVGLLHREVLKYHVDSIGIRVQSSGPPSGIVDFLSIGVLTPGGSL